MASNMKFQKVMVAEYGKNHIYEEIRRYYQAELVSVRGEFQLDKMLFIPTADEAEVKNKAGMEDLFLVVDCGSDIEKLLTINHFCARSFLLCQLMPWRMEHLHLLLQDERAQDISKLLVTRGKERIGDLRKKDQIKATRWQEAEDPFGISTKRLKELYQLTFG
ncbi:hypothetical protein SAMN02910358_01127 [Lachnospiraceae bacterium XBB1006]|nr:hypothetical protein SAMN02910358_01127 [Lachnospiraceae bacterium XBB1006]